MIDYDAKSWVNVLTTVRGSVAPRLLPRTLLVAAIGFGAKWLYDHYGFHTPATVHTMIGVALGLLLVFRTNASFDRWWEGRKLLGGMVNRTRDISRQAAAFFADDEEMRAAVARLVAAFFTVAMQGLRSETDLGKAGDLLTEGERKALEPLSVARGAAILALLSRRLHDRAMAGKLSEVRLLAMDANVTALIDYQGGCERIVRTPVPFAYAHHIKTFVTLFCFSVPFAIVDVMKGYTPLAAAILAYAMIGIDEIGVEIEDPFGYDANDLPIERIGTGIAAGAREIIGT